MSVKTASECCSFPQAVNQAHLFTHGNRREQHYSKTGASHSHNRTVKHTRRETHTHTHTHTLSHTTLQPWESGSAGNEDHVAFLTSSQDLLGHRMRAKHTHIHTHRGLYTNLKTVFKITPLTSSEVLSEMRASLKFSLSSPN